MKDSKKIRNIILNWYTKYRRDLPWRNTRNPYHILVSEVMLQQTQVDRVIPKYLAFLDQFPDTRTLAQAKTAAVITAWKGLGYNRRALFLQRTAKQVEEVCNGRFPQTIDELKKLPGVGDYTARAILSFAFEQAVPMMDTNHRRCYQRVWHGITAKKDQELLKTAEKVFAKNRAYDWNQALMDFGSAMCTSKKPSCDVCPLQDICKAYPKILTHTPRKLKKKKKSVPFRETNRYYRGQIVDALRDTAKLHQSYVFDRFNDIPKGRLEKIIVQLEKDGLIKRKNRYLCLP